MNIILEGIVGSIAYGLATEDSDIDKLGVYLAPTQRVLSFNKPKESIVTTDPDVTYHEFEKFMKLCAKNNPTVMELLWLDDYTIKTDIGAELIAIRQHFLSQNVRNTYSGYARQQAEKLKKRGDFGSDLKKRQAKHGRHCTRLLLQGTHLLKTGEIQIKLSDTEVEYIRMMGDMAEKDIDFFSKETDKLFHKFNNTLSYLPDNPPWEYLDEFLIEIRVGELHGRSI
jgi:predicted nucleotidyltransferase